jgi:hypothetical protein
MMYNIEMYSKNYDQPQPAFNMTEQMIKFINLLDERLPLSFPDQNDARVEVLEVAADALAPRAVMTVGRAKVLVEGKMTTEEGVQFIEACLREIGIREYRIDDISSS